MKAKGFDLSERFKEPKKHNENGKEVLLEILSQPTSPTKKLKKWLTWLKENRGLSEEEYLTLKTTQIVKK